MVETFKLQEGEEILKDYKPMPSLKLSLFFSYFVAVLIVGFSLFMFIVPIIFLAFFENSISTIVLIGMVTSFFLTIIFSWIIASMAYNKRHYWITNRRIIAKVGLIGYKVSSVPLERISDVIVTRTFWENIFGYGSLYCQSLAGQMGKEIIFQAVPEPEENQKYLFDLIKKNRKEGHITF